MIHPFQDALVTLIGTPLRCNRQVARQELVNAGGIPDEVITAFTSYVVAFYKADETKAYKNALYYESYGTLSILTEEQFFAILEEKHVSSKKTKHHGDDVMHDTNADVKARESKRITQDILNRKHMNFLERNGIYSNESRVKINLSPLDRDYRADKARGLLHG
ncbi:MAG: hypothetical protein FWG94_10040 [Oscillospiraceae bacterium]|nr:hypothetical protein [Oscillospiraceae bacterium]